MTRSVRKPGTSCLPLPRLVLAVLVVGALLCGPRAVDAAGTPEQKCQAGKNKLVGKYVLCRENAEATRAASGDIAKFTTAINKCGSGFVTAWQKLEGKAATAGARCLDGAATASTFQPIADDYTSHMATALAGGALPKDCLGDLGTCQDDLDTCQAAVGRWGTCPSDLGTCQSNLTVAQRCGNAVVDEGEACDQSQLAGKTCASLAGFQAGTLKCGEDCSFDTSGCFAQRFEDNGNGTVSDRQTGLQWEKKTNDDITVHGMSNLYTWGSTDVPYPPNGTAYTDFLAKLNGGLGAGTCLAGHCDWRLPTVEELQTILLHPYSCGTSPCIAAVFGPTVANNYWSATTTADSPDGAWFVYFGSGDVLSGYKDDSYYARAVRAGS